VFATVVEWLEVAMAVFAHPSSVDEIIGKMWIFGEE
jgi:hypothetical protein